MVTEDWGRVSGDDSRACGLKRIHVKRYNKDLTVWKDILLPWQRAGFGGGNRECGTLPSYMCPSHYRCQLKVLCVSQICSASPSLMWACCLTDEPLALGVSWDVGKASSIHPAPLQVIATVAICSFCEWSSPAKDLFLGFGKKVGEKTQLSN